MSKETTAGKEWGAAFLNFENFGILIRQLWVQKKPRSPFRPKVGAQNDGFKKTSERSNVGRNKQPTTASDLGEVVPLPTCDLSEVGNDVSGLISSNIRPLRGQFKPY